MAFTLIRLLALVSTGSFAYLIPENDNSSSSPLSPFGHALAARPIGWTQAPANASLPQNASDCHNATTQAPIQPMFKRSINESVEPSESVCDVNSIHATVFEAALQMQLSGEDPHTFTDFGWDCVIHGMSSFQAMHVNCSKTNDVEVFNGHFILPHINCTCRCNRNLSEFNFLDQLYAHNLSIHTVVTKDHDDDVVMFYFRDFVGNQSTIFPRLTGAYELDGFAQGFNAIIDYHVRDLYDSCVSKLLQLIGDKL